MGISNRNLITLNLCTNLYAFASSSLNYDKFDMPQGHFVYLEMRQVVNLHRRHLFLEEFPFTTGNALLLCRGSWPFFTLPKTRALR